MQNILLVGATGNLGSRLVKELVKHQKDVHALIRPETMTDPKKVNPLKELGVRLVEGDLNDPVRAPAICLTPKPLSRRRSRPPVCRIR